MAETPNPHAPGYAPGYWMHETSGVLRPVVEKYLNGWPLTPEDIATMRAYLRQWVNAKAWDDNPNLAADTEGKATLAMLRLMVDEIRAPHNIKQWLDIATELGMDPL